MARAAKLISNENYEVAEKLKKLQGPVRELHAETMELKDEDVTDERYKLEDRKRMIVVGAFAQLFRNKFFPRHCSHDPQDLGVADSAPT